MKKILTLFFIAALTISSLCGCKEKNSATALSKHVDKIEKEYSEYDSDDWEKADIEFQELLSYCEENYGSLSEEDKEVMLNAIGRYYGLAAKQGIKDFSKEINDALKSLPSLLKGFSDAFKEQPTDTEDNNPIY